jgi:DNA invertase Pin-like site-specific DNA recombinase
VKSTAVGYIRVSTSDQTLGLQSQREILAQWARANEIELVSVFEDQISGATSWFNRPGLMHAVDAIRTGVSNTLVVVKLDRLSRDVLNAESLFLEIRKHSARVLTAVDDPATDQDTPERVLMRQMLSTFAEYERSVIRQRTKRALAILKAKGVKLGRPSLTDSKHPKAKSAVMRIYQLRQEGLSIAEITRRLNAERQPNPTEKPWNDHTVKATVHKLDSMTYEAIGRTFVKNELTRLEAAANSNEHYCGTNLGIGKVRR